MTREVKITLYLLAILFMAFLPFAFAGAAAEILNQRNTLLLFVIPAFLAADIFIGVWVFLRLLKVLKETTLEK